MEFRVDSAESLIRTCERCFSSVTEKYLKYDTFGNKIFSCLVHIIQSATSEHICCRICVRHFIVRLHFFAMKHNFLYPSVSPLITLRRKLDTRYVSFTRCFWKRKNAYRMTTSNSLGVSSGSVWRNYFYFSFLN